MWHQSPQLEYEETTPWHRQRRTRWIVIAILLLPLSPLAFKIASLGVQRLHANNMYAACLNYTAPPLAYTEDPALQAALVNREDYSSAPLGKRPVFLQPAEWLNASSLIGTHIISLGTVFVHGRRTSGGAERLVAVDLVGVQRDAVSIRTDFATRCLDGGATFRLPQQSFEGVSSILLASGDGPLTIRSGRPDPDDATHFTVQYTIGKTSGTIDGWLKDDDRVLLEPRVKLFTATTAPSQPLPALSR